MKELAAEGKFKDAHDWLSRLLLIARRTDLGLTGETAVATVNATLLLYDCAANGHVKGAALLLKTFGADLRAADEKRGATALHEAARAGRREIVQLFIEHVAGPHLNQARRRRDDDENPIY